MGLRSALLACAAVLACAVPAAAATGAGLERADVDLDVTPAEIRAQERDFAPGEAIVRFDRGTTAAERLSARRASGVGFESSLEIPRTQVVDVDGSVREAVERLRRQPGVAYAQPNYRYRALAPVPDDTFFASLWGLQDTPAPNPGVNALAAWDTTRGAGQVIAVLDTGVALDHPDIDLWDGGAGGTHGFDFVDDDAVPDDFQYHGTHVAGTAAATADNGRGIAGVAPDAEVMAVRVLDGNGSGSTADIAEGVQYAAVNGADVINLSLGGPGDGTEDQVMQDAVELADAAGAVVVVAAGNDGTDNDTEPTTPCTLPNPNVICVAAVDQAGGRAGFSNYGATTVDVAAPGTNVLSAEAEYATVFQNGLDVPTGWVTATSNGGVPWGLVTSPRTEGAASAADSPGGTYGTALDEEQGFAQSTLVRSTGIDLVGESGCHLSFDLRTDLEQEYDYLAAGVIGATEEESELTYFTGSSHDSFFAEEMSISSFDGRSDVKPIFTLLSDSGIELDGVNVDDVRVRCRAAAPPAGSYAALNGTSMATPHVAGVVALLGAAYPAASNADIVRAVKAGVVQLPALVCATVTGGTVDASAAIAALASGAAPPDGCPAVQPPVQPPPAAPIAPPVSPPPPAPTELAHPAKPNLAGARSTVRVTRRGVLSYSFKAAPGLSGRAVFRTRVKAKVSRRAHVTVASKAFSVSPTGRVTVKAKLSRKTLRILRRNRGLLLNARVSVRNATGLSATATKRLTLLPPRR